MALGEWLRVFNGTLQTMGRIQDVISGMAKRSFGAYAPKKVVHIKQVVHLKNGNVAFCNLLLKVVG